MAYTNPLASSTLTGLTLNSMSPRLYKFSKSEMYRVGQAETEGKYIKKINGKITVLPAGFLPAHYRDDDESEKKHGEPAICMDDERDISNYTKAKRFATTIDIGLVYLEEQSKTGAFFFVDAIIPYRVDVGIMGNNRSNTGQSGYMTTWCYVGIPIDRYNWIVNDLSEFYGIKFSKDKDTLPKTDDKYAWPIANIQKNTKPQCVFDDGTGRPQSTAAVDLMMTIKKGLKGVVGCTLSLRRDPKVTGEPEYILSVNFGVMELNDVTELSPPTSAVQPHMVLSGTGMSAELAKLLNQAMSGQPVPTAVAPTGNM
ncbi:hypothetical protein HDU99_006172 [Rhizoclosmatium hyalinum]|nr:hypothetical protein HDU99_006172 [Rhizoclosmatium hyalinum]